MFMDFQRAGVGESPAVPSSSQWATEGAMKRMGRYLPG
jgi:hypothetical protein